MFSFEEHSMKRLLSAVVVVGIVAGAVFLSRPSPSPAGAQGDKADFQARQEAVNPWSHLKFNSAPATFRFAIVSDRTGAPRAGVFERAVEQLNILQPEFVVTVGDLVDGDDEPAKFNEQWQEFNGFISKLEMPFFYLPGNHDLYNPQMHDKWKEMFGRRYYHFVYKNVLFLMLNSEDPGGKKAPGKFGPEQIAYFKRVLAENKDVRWTMVYLHRPIWNNKNVERTGWLAIEAALQGRRFTVFCGHEHIYQREIRNGMKFYTLATTGGGSKLRGTPFGEFDHIVWVTMKADGPILANLMMEGIFPDDVVGAGKERASE
jgi:3',5'-cyclic AMP phosphodiesterase CpdA